MIFRRTQLHQMLGDDDEVDEHLEGPVVVQGIDQIQLSMKSEGKFQNSEKKAWFFFLIVYNKQNLKTYTYTWELILL